MNLWQKNYLVAGMLTAMLVFPASQSRVGAQGRAQEWTMTPLRAEMQRPFLVLFERNSERRFSGAEIESQRRDLKAGEHACLSVLFQSAGKYKKQIEATRRTLKAKGTDMPDEERHILHCRIQDLELLKGEAEILSRRMVPTTYNILLAKLDLFQRWPRQHRKAYQEISDGSYRQRRWANVNDIGFRQIAGDQREDLKWTRKKMRQNAFLASELEDPQIQAYVQSVADRLTRNSDLEVPAHVTVLDSPDVDAFSLPSGYIFIGRGLLEAVDDEAELAGVIAHELGHSAARHGARIEKRALMTELFYQGSQLGAMIFTDGIPGVALYYGLDYSFYPVRRARDVNLLDSGRRYELEADRLAVQYAWKSDYDPTGFIRLFDAMTTQIGRPDSNTWFHTHPLSSQRMIQAEREIMFMPKQSQCIVQTSEFQEMKSRLSVISALTKRDGTARSATPWVREKGCVSTRERLYNPKMSVEELCATIGSDER